MLIHTVLIAPADTPDAPEAIRAACAGLAALDVPGILAFHHGPNRDFEGKSARYTYGFTVHFADRAANLAYDAHPEHRRLGGQIVAHAEGGHAGIFVSDLEV